MKKLLLCIVAVFAFSFAQAQESGFKIGVNLDIPMGDASDFSSIAFGVDAAYLWEISPEFKAGVTAGYLNFSAKKIDGYKPDNMAFIPIAATAQYSLMESLFVGADLGYALGVSPKSNDGGFYYLPKIGYQIDLFEVYVGYKGISAKSKAETVSIPGIGEFTSESSSATLNAIVIGFNYKL